MTKKLPRRELVTLAKPFDPNKHKIAGWLMSEKLDGTRCFWDGGVTRGMRTIDVPWAGILNPKTLEQKEKIKPISTGLWSRYGNPIMAPDWFLDKLPAILMDGELFAGRNNFQLCRSIVAGDAPDSRWEQIKYMIYGAPSLEVITMPGLIKNPQYYCEIKDHALQDMLAALGNKMQKEGIENKTVAWLQEGSTFDYALESLHELLADCEVAQVHLQVYLPHDEELARRRVDETLTKVVAEGGEGVIIRNPQASYEIKRTANLLKAKPENDDEGILVGYTAGAGKHAGKIGALILDYKGKRLEIGTGLTDAERELYNHPFDTAPGKDHPESVSAKHFTCGERITFKYREFTDAGIPKEARYFRKRGEE